MATTINLGRVKGSMWYVGTATTSAAIQQQITQAGKVPLEYDLYVCMNSNPSFLGTVWQYTLVNATPTWVNSLNIRGPQGIGFAISKTYASVALMNAGYATDGVPLNGFVLIETGNVEDTDNAKLYTKGATKYNYLTDLSGSQGFKGDQGDQGDQGQKGDTGVSVSALTIAPKTAGSSTYVVTVRFSDNTTATAGEFTAPKGDKGADGADGAAATVTVGTTQTGAPGTNAVVTNGGTANAAVLNFIIPKGETGGTGPIGPQGLKGEAGQDGRTPTLSINANGEMIATFAD